MNLPTPTLLNLAKPLQQFSFASRRALCLLTEWKWLHRAERWGPALCPASASSLPCEDPIQTDAHQAVLTWDELPGRKCHVSMLFPRSHQPLPSSPKRLALATYKVLAARMHSETAGAGAGWRKVEGHGGGKMQEWGDEALDSGTIPLRAIVLVSEMEERKAGGLAEHGEQSHGYLSTSTGYSLQVSNYSMHLAI